MTIEHREFFFGRKNVSLDMNTETKTATIRFGTQEPRWLHPKKMSETTIIFHMAEKTLQQTVEETQEPYTLLFDTSNTNLKKWMRAKSEQLQFDEIVPEDCSSYHVRAKNYLLPDRDDPFLSIASLSLYKRCTPFSS